MARKLITRHPAQTSGSETQPLLCEPAQGCPPESLVFASAVESERPTPRNADDKARAEDYAASQRRALMVLPAVGIGVRAQVIQMIADSCM